MCSEYHLKTDPKTVGQALGESLVNQTEQLSWDLTVKFSIKAPVIRSAPEGGHEIVERIFPVSPFPNSRLSGFANQSDGKDTDQDESDDRQIRRIYEVPRWKQAFESQPYLVPMTGFTEYAYWGERAGQALEFKIPDAKLFFAAGIGLKPFVPKTGKDNGFSIITHTATAQMLDYHQRLIVLLKPEHALNYLNEMSARERFDFLIENRYQGDLEVSKLRTMAKGWEKRAPVQNAKLEKEKSYQKILKAERVEG